MIRELKLYDLCGEISPNVIEINDFFSDLFRDLSVYTQDGKSDLIFMKGGKYIMKQDLKYNTLWCRYAGFWEILKEKYTLKYTEIQEVISYKVATMVEDAFKKGSLTPSWSYYRSSNWVEDAFKKGSLTPEYSTTTKAFLVEEAFKKGFLTPQIESTSYICLIEEAFKVSSLTQILNDNEKANFLKENGWTDLWHVDNWVKKEWFKHPTIDIDRAGYSTDMAYNICKNTKK
jgi:hypothetical protein